MRVAILTALIASCLISCKSTGDSDKTQDELKTELESILTPEPESTPVESITPSDSLDVDSLSNPSAE